MQICKYDSYFDKMCSVLVDIKDEGLYPLLWLHRYKRVSHLQNDTLAMRYDGLPLIFLFRGHKCRMVNVSAFIVCFLCEDSGF